MSLMCPRPTLLQTTPQPVHNLFITCSQTVHKSPSTSAGTWRNRRQNDNVQRRKRNFPPHPLYRERRKFFVYTRARAREIFAVGVRHSANPQGYQQETRRGMNKKPPRVSAIHTPGGRQKEHRSSLKNLHRS